MSQPLLGPFDCPCQASFSVWLYILSVSVIVRLMKCTSHVPVCPLEQDCWLVFIKACLCTEDYGFAWAEEWHSLFTWDAVLHLLLLLLVYPSEISFPFWLAGTALLILLSSSWWSCPACHSKKASNSLFVLRHFTLADFSYVDGAMALVHPWWKHVLKTRFASFQTKISVC